MLMVGSFCVSCLEGLMTGGSFSTLLDGGDAVVDGQRGLVVDGLVGGRVLVHLGLEAQQHARVGAGLPVGGNPVPGERGLERVGLLVPLHLVGALRDDAAGSQVGDLQGLLVRGGVLGIGVAQLDGGHRICLVRRDLRVHAHGVFHGLAGEHGLGVDAGLVAALGGFGDDLLVDRGARSRRSSACWCPPCCRRPSGRPCCRGRRPSGPRTC